MLPDDMTGILGFSADQVCRLTGLTMRQLRYWDRSGFFSPRFGDRRAHRPYSRVYSFRDVVGLRALALLRNVHRVPLQELRAVGARLAEQFDAPWASLTFYVAGRRVFFDDPRTGVRMDVRTGQTVFPFAMLRIAREMQDEVGRLRERDPGDVGRVVRHRYLVHNEPVLAGTRIPTTAVWNFHHAGYDTEAIIAEYPRLTPVDVRAAISYEEQRRQKRAG